MRLQIAQVIWTRQDKTPKQTCCSGDHTRTRTCVRPEAICFCWAFGFAATFEFVLCLKQRGGWTGRIRGLQVACKNVISFTNKENVCRLSLRKMFGSHPYKTISARTPESNFASSASGFFAQRYTVHAVMGSKNLVKHPRIASTTGEILYAVEKERTGCSFLTYECQVSQFWKFSKRLRFRQWFCLDILMSLLHFGAAIMQWIDIAMVIGESGAKEPNSVHKSRSIYGKRRPFWKSVLARGLWNRNEICTLLHIVSTCLGSPIRCFHCKISGHHVRYFIDSEDIVAIGK